jgi:gliding motility-associated-like protein
VSYYKTFYIQYTLGSCVSTWQAVLVSVFDQSKLTLPNAFSPNGDGINDVFKMQVQGIITIKEWLIFNRYGQLIFSTNDSVTGWDGKMKNAYVPVGTYYWIVNATDNNGKEIKQQGSVTVLR